MNTLLFLTDASPPLHGYITRWLLQAAPGTYFGTLTRRVADNLWTTIATTKPTPTATLIRTANNEQRFTTRHLGTPQWEARDHDGLTLFHKQSTRGRDPHPTPQPAP